MFKSFFLLATIVGVISCSSDNDKSIEELIASASDTTNPVNITPGKTDSQLNSTNNLPAANTSSSSSATTGVNPAHGQPGHRCELAVGAPLNSAPATSNPVKTSTGNLNNVQVTPAATTPKTQSKAGLNPAHGEPGHRCDIAVGQPLSSTPAVTTTPSTTSAVSPTPPVYTPTTINTENKSATNPINTVKLPEANTGGNAKLNPAHGEPGHDCSIAVGQPLKKQ